MVEHLGRLAKIVGVDMAVGNLASDTASEFLLTFRGDPSRSSRSSDESE
jgi:hypothetical protein